MWSIRDAATITGIIAVFSLSSCSSTPKATSPKAPSQQKKTTPAATAAADQVEEIRKSHDLPALAVVQFQDGQMSEAGFAGYQKRGSPTHIQWNERFPLGSCTKAMTATLIGRLMEEGKLFWNQPLSEVFPDLKMHPAWRDVTVEMITSYRAGFPPNILPYLRKDVWRKLDNPSLSPAAARALFLKAALSLPPVKKPGLRFIYGNTGYVVLGAMIDRLSGTSWENSVREQLFEPLGMKSCGFGAPASVEASDNPALWNSATGVYCNLPDWAKFLQMHSDGFNGKKGLLLYPQTFAKLHQPYPGQEYTYGGWLRTEQAWAGGPVLMQRGGGPSGFAQAWIAPAKNRVVAGASNTGTPGAEAAILEAMEYFVQMEGQ